MAGAVGEGFDEENHDPDEIIGSAFPLDLSALSDAQVFANIPADPFEGESLDDLAVSVVWPTHETDILETELFGVRSSELEKIREETGTNLITVVKTMLEYLSNSDEIYDPYKSRPREDESDIRYGCISWTVESYL